MPNDRVYNVRMNMRMCEHMRMYMLTLQKAGGSDGLGGSAVLG